MSYERFYQSLLKYSNSDPDTPREEAKTASEDEENSRLLAEDRDHVLTMPGQHL